MNYEEKQAMKLDRYQELSRKAITESNARREQSDRLSSAIPFGQPILVGHHSERRHRRDIERIHNNMDKNIELQEKAEHYKKKAENILNPSAISSDNPEAIKLLQDKLKGLEEKRARAKELKKQGKEIPSWFFTNLSGNIRSVKERIKQLEEIKSIPDIDKTINGIQIKSDKEENRIKIFFPDIPSEEIRTQLKRNGFKWSRYNQCWQRQLNNASIYQAEEIIKGVE